MPIKHFLLIYILTGNASHFDKDALTFLEDHALSMHWGLDDQVFY
jgi:hypothetical protein